VSEELVAAIALALAFAFTNGFHDAANAIAVLVATRAARPLPAVLMASFFTVLGPLLVGGAVAETIAGIVDVPEQDLIEVVGSALAGATAWNIATWARGLPSSSGHALVGGLVGAALAYSGLDAVNWGGLDGWHPVGVFGVLIALAVTPLLGGLAAYAGIRLLRRALRRATRAVNSPIRGGEWITSAWLAFSHGSNDAQKAIGLAAVLLFAGGEISDPVAPLWTELACGAALTLGTAFGGWRIVKTVGRRIYPLRPLDGLASQTSAAGLILASSLVGAPVSTTHVVASSVVGTGGGRGQWRRVNWAVVREIGLAWITTIPASGVLAALVFVLWRSLS
jgi:PiT family inorganic phosphate transporter